MAETADIDKQLAWERRQRPRAGVAAMLGAAGLVAYLVIAEALAKDAPSPGFIPSLQRALQPGLLTKETSLQTPVFQYLHDHGALVLAGGITGLVSYLGVGWAVAFLGAATHPRNPSLPRWAVLLPLIGGGLTGLGSLLLQISSYTKSSSFLDGPRTVAEATSTPGCWCSPSCSGCSARSRSPPGSCSSRSMPCGPGCLPASTACSASSPERSW